MKPKNELHINWRKSKVFVKSSDHYSLNYDNFGKQYTKFQKNRYYQIKRIYQSSATFFFLKRIFKVISLHEFDIREYFLQNIINRGDMPTISCCYVVLKDPLKVRSTNSSITKNRTFFGISRIATPLLS